MKLTHILLALMPLCIASCSEEENVVPGYAKPEVRVTAGAGAHSRIALSDDEKKTHTLWQNGDRISLFTATQSNLVYSTTTEENVATAEFVPVGEGLDNTEGEVVYACYPEEAQVAEEGLVVNLPATATIDYADGAIRSFGYAVGTISEGEVRLGFKHISAFLCLKVTPEELADSTKAISQVTVSTSSDVPLSVGEGDTFDFTTLTATTTNGSNTVQMNVGSHVVDSVWTFYVPILPQPAGADITIALTDSEGAAQYTVTKQVPESGFLAGNVYKHGFLNAADVAYLVDGPTFNERIRQLASSDYYDTNIKKVEFVTESQAFPDEHIIVSADDSPALVCASFNETDGVLTVQTPAKSIEIVNASYMFSYLEFLETIDWGNFKVNETTTSTNEMFQYCYSLKNLDVSNWNTVNVVDMGYMFDYCYSLETLDVSNWNTANVERMYSMFSYCSSLGSLELANWETGNVTNMGSMFRGCSALTALDISDWNVGNVTYMYDMFSGCSALTALDLSDWNVGNVTNMGSMFSDCSALTTLDVSNWNTENVTEMNYMFSYCSSLTALDVSNWNTANVRYMDVLFGGCSSLVSLDLADWETGNVSDMRAMFEDCSALRGPLDLSNWNTANVRNMGQMFRYCAALTSVDVSGWNVSNVTDMTYMFDGCSALTALDVSDWRIMGESDYGVNFGAMFRGCSSLVALDVSNWDTRLVYNMGEVFSGCSSLMSLDLSGWNVTHVDDMNGLFKDCHNLNSLNIAGWRLHDGIRIYDMFDQCASASQACEITAIQTAKDFLLNQTGTTYMNPDYFVWNQIPTAVYEKDVLMDFYETMNGDSWTNNTNWNSDRPLGEWYGITTDEEGQVTSIDLSNNNLTGTVQVYFSDFSKLESFNIDNNSIENLHIVGNANIESISLNNPATGVIRFENFKTVEISCESLTALRGSCETLKVSNCNFGSHDEPFSEVYVTDATIYNCQMYNCGLSSDTLTFESSKTTDTWYCHTRVKLNIINSYCSTINNDFYDDTVIYLENATLWRSNWDENSLVTIPSATITGAEWYSLFESE